MLDFTAAINSIPHSLLIPSQPRREEAEKSEIIPTSSSVSTAPVLTEDTPTSSELLEEPSSNSPSVNSGSTSSGVASSSSQDDESAEAFDPNLIEEELRAEEGSNRHMMRTVTYICEKAVIVNLEKIVTVEGPQNIRTFWKVRSDLTDDDVPPIREYFKETGQVLDFEFCKQARKVKNKRCQYPRINLHKLLIHLWPGSEKDQLKN